MSSLVPVGKAHDKAEKIGLLFKSYSNTGPGLKKHYL